MSLSEQDKSCPRGEARLVASIPSGTVTFAFTDIEGSTERWDADRAEMQGAVQRHDELLRGAIEAHDGHVFKTIGDAFCAAFARPEDAVAAMLDAQRALAAEDFDAVRGVRVRAAIHTGTADERNGDYFGPAVNRVARLLAVGHGGQVLASGVTSDLVQGDLPPQASLRDLGEHRLKDLSRPEQVYQLLAPDLQAEFPPLRSLNSLPNNLPLMVTSFVGRETEVAEIEALIAANRLVTLVGSGGIGKTRTSLQVAANDLDGSGDGVWFIELAPLTSGEYIPRAVAQAMNLALPAEGDALESLVRMLKGKDALLVFDNCEHLVEDAARAIAALQRGCPRLNIIASSRQGLGVAGEVTYRMPSLSIGGSIGLFVERARAVEQRFAVTDENEPSIVEICRRLDGIPLAIELAAARVKMLSPRQIRERLDERFRVLTGGSRDVLPRQQTLRALIDWSHDLLDERERALFRRLGVFVNGFLLEGAVAVGIGDALDELDVFDVLASLVDKSLVLAEPDGDTLRYRLLESTRVYAREKLERAAEQESAAEAHARYLHDRFVDIKARFDRSARSMELYDAFIAELEDIRSALDWAVSRDAVLGADLLIAGGPGLVFAGVDAEGAARARAFIDQLGDDQSRLLALLWILIAQLIGGPLVPAESMSAALRGVDYARSAGDPLVLGEALVRVAFSASITEAFEAGSQALEEADRIPNLSAWVQLRSSAARGQLGALSGDYTKAVAAYRELVKRHRSLGNGADERGSTLNLAEAVHALGDSQEAITLIEAVLPTARDQKDRLSLVNLLANASGYYAAVGDLENALATARESLVELASREPDGYRAIAILHLAHALAMQGRQERAARLVGYADAAMQEYGVFLEFNERNTHELLMTELTHGLDDAERAKLLTEGAALSADAVMELALQN